MSRGDWIWMGLGIAALVVLCLGMMPVRIRADWWEKITRRDRHG